MPRVMNVSQSLEKPEPEKRFFASQFIITAKGRITDYEKLRLDMDLSVLSNISDSSLMSKDTEKAYPDDPDLIRQMIWTGMIPVLNDILLYMPDEYQQLLLSWINE